MCDYAYVLSNGRNKEAFTQEPRMESQALQRQRRSFGGLLEVGQGDLLREDTDL